MSVITDQHGSSVSNSDDAHAETAPEPAPTPSQANSTNSDTAAPFMVASPKLTRNARVGLVVAALLLVAMVFVPLMMVRHMEQQSREALSTRFSVRADLGASFVSGFTEDLAERQTARATRDLSAPSDPRAAFNQMVDSFVLDAAVLLDAEGRVLEVFPARDDILGADLASTYPHLATALTGQVAVSNVVSSAANAVPVVAVAVPFETPRGRHVFSGAFAAANSQLGNYFKAAVPPSGGSVYLIDAKGQTIVASSTSADSATLTPAQLSQFAPGSSDTTVDGVSYHVANTAVDGTPWAIVLITPSDALYAPVDTDTWKMWVLLAAFTVASLGAFVLLVRLAQARAVANASASEQGKQAMMLGSVIANNHSLIYVKDLEGRYLLANPSFARAFSVTEEEILGKTDHYLDPDLAPIWKANDIRARDGLYEVEEWSDGAHGRLTYESMKFPLHDAKGVLYATCGVSLEVTERRFHVQATEAARDAALSAAIAQRDFAASAAHELRTPTTSIIGYVEEILENNNQSEEDRGFLEIVHRNAQRLSRLIDDLLIADGNGIGAETMHPEPTAIGALIEVLVSSLRAMARSKGVLLVVDCPHDLPLVMIDPLRTDQAFVNLISNAIKFTPDGGSVKITASAHHDPEDCGATAVQVVVVDTGIGIDSGEIDSVFDRFYRSTTARESSINGTGLGLPIAKSMIEAQDGRITIASTPGIGTRITVTLPVAGMHSNVVVDLPDRTDDQPDQLVGSVGHVGGRAVVWAPTVLVATQP